MTFEPTTLSPQRSRAGRLRRSRARSRGAVSAAAAARARAHARTRAQHAREQVRQQRIDERDRDVDPRGAEERVGDREREQHGEVEVQQPQRRAREREHEQRAQRQPDPERVGDAAERAGVAARHRPVDLVAGPALEHAAAAVVDHRLGDLLGALAVAPRRGEERDLPAAPCLALVVDAPVGQRAAGAGARAPPARAATVRITSAGAAAPAGRRAVVARGRGQRGRGRAGRRVAQRGEDADRRGAAGPPQRRAAHAAGTPKCSRTIGTMSRSDHWARASALSGPVPHHSSVPSESLACSEPCEPPPTWWSPPQSMNS